MWTRKAKLSDDVISVILGYTRDRGVPVPGDGIDRNAGLKDFGLDSMDQVAIVNELEEHFNIALGRDDVAGAQTIGDLIELVGRERDAVLKR